MTYETLQKLSQKDAYDLIETYSKKGRINDAEAKDLADKVTRQHYYDYPLW
ncbi:MAG: hypothetical protein ACYCX2_12030 [Christensenellales bacterium]